MMPILVKGDNVRSQTKVIMLVTAGTGVNGLGNDFYPALMPTKLTLYDRIV